MSFELLALRVIHVVGGVLWVGSMFLVLFFLQPAIKKAGPAGGQVMQGLAERKVMVIIPIIAVVTMLAGIRLMMIQSGGFQGDYFSSRSGMTYAIGGALTVIGFAIGIAINRPAALRMAEISKLMSSSETDREKLSAEMKALQDRAAAAGVITAILLLLAAGAMSIARYV